MTQKDVPEDPVDVERRQKVKEAMIHAWSSYEKYAWGKDELQVHQLFSKWIFTLAYTYNLVKMEYTNQYWSWHLVPFRYEVISSHNSFHMLQVCKYCCWDRFLGKIKACCLKLFLFLSFFIVSLGQKMALIALVASEQLW